MKTQWLVTKQVAPFGFVIRTYLSHPRQRGVEVWDERHDAKRFYFWAALWHAIWHWAWIEKDVS